MTPAALLALSSPGLAEAHENRPLIVVIGLGYVGAPLALALAKAYDVVGVDLNEERVEELKRGEDSTHELDLAELASSLCKFEINLDFVRGMECQVIFIVTVPTPVTDANIPDLRPLEGASRDVATVIKRGDVVVYESTVYPGVTEEVCVPILEASGYKWLKDFNVGYSPERVNPGDKVHTLRTTTKVVAGDTSETLELLAELYEAVTTVYRAPSIKVAEAAKVIENTQRDVNIALMNELSQIFCKLNIDTLDVIDAAASKWNFLLFKPGLVGGHCISVDPFYLTHRAAIAGYSADLILSSRQINDEMVDHVISETAKMMLAYGIGGASSVITVIGCTFKENVPDIRNSKVFSIERKLREEYNFKVQVYDPWADIVEVEQQYGVTPYVVSQLLKPSEVIILAVPHSVIVDEGWDSIASISKSKPFILMDLKGAMNRETTPPHCILWRP